MKHSILLGAMALLTACGSAHKVAESHSVEKYHQQVEAHMRVADSLTRHRVLVLDSPLIEIELPADSVSPARKVRITARRAALADETTATTTVATDSAATTQAEHRADAAQSTDRSSHPWLVFAILLVFLLCYISRRFIRS